jgi:hypothetical protein
LMATHVTTKSDAYGAMLEVLRDCREALRRAGAAGELAVVDAAIAAAERQPRLVELPTGHVFVADSIVALVPVYATERMGGGVDVIGVGFREHIQIKHDEPYPMLKDDARALVDRFAAECRQCVWPAPMGSYVEARDGWTDAS